MTNQVANKTQKKAQVRRQEALLAERRRQYESEKRGQTVFFAAILGATALVAVIVLVVTLCADVVFIHNTGMTENGGREVAVRGSALLRALFTGTYTSADAGYDNLAVPFYYYAQAWCRPLAILTFLAAVGSALAVLMAAAAAVFAARKREFVLTWFSLAGAVLTWILVTAALAVALSMQGSRILPVYCSGNPACSIQSDLVWCFGLCLLAVVANLVAIVRFIKLEKLRKAAGVRGAV